MNSSYVFVRQNEVVAAVEGIQLAGAVTTSLVAGNFVAECRFAAIDIDNLSADSRDNLPADNTLLRSSVLMRCVDEPPYEDYVAGQLTLSHNLMIEPVKCNAVALRFSQDGRQITPVEGTELSTLLWRGLVGLVNTTCGTG